MYCQQLTPSAKGESSCLFCCWKGSDPKRESERAQEKAKLFFRHFKTKLQTLSALREMDETLPPAVTFVATGQRRGGSPGQGSKPEAHVAFGMGTLEWELWNGNSRSHCCIPGTRFQFPVTKPLGFHDSDAVIALGSSMVGSYCNPNHAPGMLGKGLGWSGAVHFSHCFTKKCKR